MSKQSFTPGPWFAVNDGTVSEPMMSVKAARIAGRSAIDDARAAIAKAQS